MLADALAPTDARALRAVTGCMRELRNLETTLVVRLRDAGVSWRDIGELLGVRAQSAHRRFRAVDPQPAQRLRLPWEV